MRPTFFVVTPKTERPAWGHVNGRIDLLSRCLSWPDGPLVHFSPQLRGYYIADERNVHTHAFLQAGASHLVFIDSDIVFTADDIFALHAADKDVICASHHLKDDSGRIAGCSDEEEQGEFARCEFAPGGLLMVTRRAMLKACAHRDTFMTRVPSGQLVDNVWGPIHREDEKIYVQDDYAFSLRCREEGIGLWRHTKVWVGHVGEKVY